MTYKSLPQVNTKTPMPAVKQAKSMNDIYDFIDNSNFRRPKISNLSKADGVWIHRPWFKVAINCLLRAAQFWREKPILLASDIEFDKNDYPVRLLGYRFIRVTISE